MSKHDCRAARAGLGVAVLALTLAASAGPAAAQTRAQMQLREKALVESHRATYRVSQGDRELGSEVVTVRTYNTNTVVYEGKIRIEHTEAVGYDESTRLEVEEDSYFPRSYRSTREMWNGDARFTHAVSVEMFSNVAVIDTKLRGSTETRRLVLPAGSVIVETGVLYLCRAVLPIYNEEAGGRQAFPALDPVTGKTEQVVVERIGPQDVTVDGKTVAAKLYTVDREKFPVKLAIDADGRLVWGDMTSMTYELVSWENDVGEGE